VSRSIKRPAVAEPGLYLNILLQPEPAWRKKNWPAQKINSHNPRLITSCRSNPRGMIPIYRFRRRFVGPLDGPKLSPRTVRHRKLLMSPWLNDARWEHRLCLCWRGKSATLHDPLPFVSFLFQARALHRRAKSRRLHRHIWTRKNLALATAQMIKNNRNVAASCPHGAYVDRKEAPGITKTHKQRCDQRA
jgi:hypothetical protein